MKCWYGTVKAVKFLSVIPSVKLGLKMNLFSFGVSFNLFYFENSISSVVAKLKRGPFRYFLFHFEVIQIARVVNCVGGSWLTTVLV